MSTLSGGPNIVTDGLVLHLDAANTKSYPGSGTTWNDLSRGGNNGTLTNGPTFDSGNGGSIVFDGVDDYVNCGITNNTSTSSYSIWFFISSIPVVSRVLFSDNNTKAGLGFFGGNSFIICCGGSGNFQRRSDLLNINSNGWNNVVITYNNRIPSCYINGLESNYLSIESWTNTTNSFEIGRRSTGSNFVGNIAQVSIYNRALTPQEIQQNYNTTKTRFGL